MSSYIHSFILYLTFFAVNSFAYDITFKICNENNWLCKHGPDGTALHFKCNRLLEENNPLMEWTFKDLPPETSAIIIENCNVNLTVNVDKGYIREKLLNDGPNEFLKNFTVIRFEDITSLTLNEFSDITSFLKGEAKVILKDIKYMENFPQPLVDNVRSFSFVFADNSTTTLDIPPPKRLLVTMLNLRIKKLGFDRGSVIKWFHSSVPIRVTWEKIFVEQPTKSNIIEIVEGYKILGWKGLVEYPENYVVIRNCTFPMIDRISVTAKYFGFNSNDVGIVRPRAFNVEAQTINMVKNVFRNVSSGGFANILRGGKGTSLRFSLNKFYLTGKYPIYFSYDPKARRPGITDLHMNEFNCIKSAWLERPINDINGKNNFENFDDTGGVGTLKTYMVGLKTEIWKFEKKFFYNVDNICMDTPCQVSLKKYRAYYLAFGSSISFCDN